MATPAAGRSRSATVGRPHARSTVWPCGRDAKVWSSCPRCRSAARRPRHCNSASARRWSAPRATAHPHSSRPRSIRSRRMSSRRSPTRCGSTTRCHSCRVSWSSRHRTGRHCSGSAAIRSSPATSAVGATPSSNGAFCWCPRAAAPSPFPARASKDAASPAACSTACSTGDRASSPPTVHRACCRCARCRRGLPGATGCRSMTCRRAGWRPPHAPARARPPRWCWRSCSTARWALNCPTSSCRRSTVRRSSPRRRSTTRPSRTAARRSG